MQLAQLHQLPQEGGRGASAAVMRLQGCRHLHLWVGALLDHLAPAPEPTQGKEGAHSGQAGAANARNDCTATEQSNSAQGSHACSCQGTKLISMQQLCDAQAISLCTWHGNPAAPCPLHNLLFHATAHK